MLYVPQNNEKVRNANKSKHNFKCENHVILLMVTDGKQCHYLVVESLSALLRGITSKHKEEFYCLNCFNSYTTKNKLINHVKKLCKNHDCCYVKMHNEENKILKYNNGKKSMKHAFVVYFNLEYIFKKLNQRQNDSKKYYTEK